jgi:hypothetical protein
MDIIGSVVQLFKLNQYNSLIYHSLLYYFMLKWNYIKEVIRCLVIKAKAM